MPTQQHCEETYPLLLLFLDDETARGRRIQIEKGRYHGITTGASAVITQWPSKCLSFSQTFLSQNNLFVDNLAPCWMVSIVGGLFVFLVTLLALSAASSSTPYGHLTTRCIGSHIYDYKKINNETVHLVHESTVWQKNQIAIIEGVLQNYDAYKVHLVMVGYNKSEILFQNRMDYSVSTTRSTTRKRPRKKRERKESNVQLKKEPKRRKRSTAKTLRDVLIAHPNIFVEALNYTEAFNNSPLYNTWQNLNEKTRVFAIRTIYLWQYGGISFDLLEENYKDLTLGKNNISSIEDVVELGLNAFSKLPKGVVTIDDRGWHMESRTSCHAFFGDMLMNLRKADSSATPEEIIKKTLNVFCRRGSVDSGYCSTVKR